MRVDSFLGAYDDEKSNRGRLGVLSLIPRKDIQICIAMQFDRTFMSPSLPPRFIIMDSFSDLTDVRMRFKADTIFNANISDIAKLHRKNRNLEIGELLNTDSLEELYSNLFSKFNFFFPSVPIIFILFPTILDTRLLYRERGEKIVSVLERLKSDFPNLNVVTCPDSLVAFADDDVNKEFPYHYEDAVYRNLFNQIKTIIERSEC